MLHLRATDVAGLDEVTAEISYVPERSTLVVEGNVPVTLDARVRTIAVEVVETGELLGIARYRTFEGGGDAYTGEVLPLPAG